MYTFLCEARELNLGNDETIFLKSQPILERRATDFRIVIFQLTLRLVRNV